MQEQKLDAVAAVRTALAAEARRVPGLRVLNGHFMTIPQAAGVPKGRPVAARYVSAFIEEMKTSGFVAAALKRHGYGPDDAIVAPPSSAR
jgi:polar amino acid transport system substrate-binding protein